MCRQKAIQNQHSGSGGGNTGAFVISTNGISATNHFDNNLIDQPNVGNN